MQFLHNYPKCKLNSSRFKRSKNRATKREEKRKMKRIKTKAHSARKHTWNVYNIRVGTFQQPIRSRATCQMGNHVWGKKVGKTWAGLSAIFSRGSSRYANVSGPRSVGAGEAGFNGPAVVSPVKIDELRDNALVQSARY